MQINPDPKLDTDPRKLAIKRWLESDLGYQVVTLESASADASFRRYFRATVAKANASKGTTHSSPTFIVMDAPTELERIDLFVDIAIALAKSGVHTPEIIAQNPDQGFLLLEDLGDTTYLSELPNAPDSLYQEAIRSLIKLQAGGDYATEQYDAKKLQIELDVFPTWFLSTHLGVKMSDKQSRIWQKLCEQLINTCQEQPQVWVHRDYHSRNLMITNSESPGVIDFQDMVTGPLTYDLVSLFKDCYIEWPRERQLAWLKDYQHAAQSQLELPDFDFEQLVQWYDFTGLQRHLKVLGVFTRLHHRDNKSHYLNDLPLVAKYIDDVLGRYGEFDEFKQTFNPLIQQAAG